MTTTALHTTCRAAHHCAAPDRLFARRAWQALTRLFHSVLKQAQQRGSDWRQTHALSTMDAHLLRDMGAPDWLHQRAQSQRTLDGYEHLKAMARLRY